MRLLAVTLLVLASCVAPPRPDAEIPTMSDLDLISEAHRIERACPQDAKFHPPGWRDYSFKLREELFRRHPDWTDEVKTWIRSRRIYPGMTAIQVRASWGSPFHISSTTMAGGTSEQWDYGMSQYVYLENGVVVAVQQG